MALSLSQKNANEARSEPTVREVMSESCRNRVTFDEDPAENKIAFDIQGDSPLAIGFQESDERLIPNILMRCTATELCNLAKVNRYFRQETGQNIYWKYRLLQELPFPISLPENPKEGELKQLFRESMLPRVGDVLEIVDTVGAWVVARIIAVVKPNLILVLFEGWGPEFLQWFHLKQDADRFRPLTSLLSGLGPMGPTSEQYFNSLVSTVHSLLFGNYEEEEDGYITIWYPPVGGKQPSLYTTSSGTRTSFRLKIPGTSHESFLAMQKPASDKFIRCTDYISQECEPPKWLSHEDIMRHEGQWKERYPLWNRTKFPEGQEDTSITQTTQTSIPVTFRPATIVTDQ
eukprot:TRINITY_DN20096_c0_g1::TRINITY_DN20096_c0_g1_i1::g.15645::m.15645 TRINITY_DN20096_c0_g1::TRINITY_DN20096_c0_g1_i1::g.15645  ORF type:complete len:346 (-),score=-1.35,F-box/PF00646.28/0.17 TRINITY_DN20096_c0_g1_i1:75-1112(-)